MRLRAIVLVAAMLPAFAAANEFCDTPGAVESLRAKVNEQWRWFKEKRFAQVEAFHADLVAQHEAGRIGDARLARFLVAFQHNGAWVEPLLKEWVKQYPRSYAARVALSNHYRAVGWAARGSELASKTSKEQFALMRAAFLKSRALLDEADALTSKPTLSQAYRIDMAAADGFANPSQIYGRTIKAFPDAMEVRIQYVRKSSPRWGGSTEQLRSIMEDARTLPAADQRYIRYLVLQQMGLDMEFAENFPKAIEYLKESVPLCPGVDASLRSLMRLQDRAKDYEGAIASASEVIRRHPADGEAFFKRGFAHQELKQHPEAVADYQRAVEFAYPQAYLNLAYYYQIGKGVPMDLKKALELLLVADRLGVPEARERAELVSRVAHIPIR